MLKGIILFGVGVVIGGAVATATVKTKWEEDQKFRVDAYNELDKKYNSLAAEARKESRKEQSIAANSYDRQAIRSCMTFSTFRRSAIDVYLSGRLMSDVEKGVFQPLLPVAVNSKDKSYQMRSMDLTLEAGKLDDECLDGARIRYD